MFIKPVFMTSLHWRILARFVNRKSLSDMKFVLTYPKWNRIVSHERSKQMNRTWRKHCKNRLKRISLCNLEFLELALALKRRKNQLLVVVISSQCLVDKLNHRLEEELAVLHQVDHHYKIRRLRAKGTISKRIHWWKKKRNLVDLVVTSTLLALK